MPATARFPARSLAVGESAVVKLRDGEEQPAVIRKARSAVNAQLARAANAATSDRTRREIEKREIVVEPKGKRSIVIRRLENRAPTRAKRKAAAVA